MCNSTPLYVNGHRDDAHNEIFAQTSDGLPRTDISNDETTEENTIPSNNDDDEDGRAIFHDNGSFGSPPNEFSDGEQETHDDNARVTTRTFHSDEQHVNVKLLHLLEKAGAPDHLFNNIIHWAADSQEF